MKLPKITKDQLTNELREVVGDNDIEFESLCDSDDIWDFEIDSDAYFDRRAEVGKMLIEQRNQNEIQGYHQRSEEDT